MYLFAQIMLLVWIFVSIAMFAVLRPVRAFLLTYFIGYLLLPVEVTSGTSAIGSIVFSQSMHIDKLTACNIGALIGTLLFQSDRFARFKWHWVDAVYGLILGGIFFSSVVNGLGPKDGISHIIEELRGYIPLIFLARIYLTSEGELQQAIRTVIGAAFLYVFLAVAEWRFSPQTHRLLYGYFQHSFDQFTRYSHFRPVGFLHHAIEMAFFMSSSAALAVWLWYRKRFAPLWGLLPGGVVSVVLLVGLAVTMTFAGYGIFVLALAMFGAMSTFRSRWLLLVLPGFAMVWMAGRYTNVIDASALLKMANYFDPSRSMSLAYRLDAETLHFAKIAHNLLLGNGEGNGFVFAENGSIVHALDAWWLLNLLFFGVIGIGLRIALWSVAIIESFRRWDRLTPEMQMLATAVSVLLGLQFVDFLFNSFPSMFLLMLDMGLVATFQRQAHQQVYFAPMEWEGADEGLPEGAVAT